MKKANNLVHPKGYTNFSLPLINMDKRNLNKKSTQETDIMSYDIYLSDIGKIKHVVKPYMLN